MNKKVRNIALTGLMAAITAVIAVWQIPMPFGVPLTFQVFAVSLSGYALGKGKGTLATFIYISVGAVGIPVFTGFCGGVGVLLGPGGGFIVGFLVLSFLCGASKKKKMFCSILLGCLGVVLCHTAGVFWYSLVTDTGIGVSFLMTSLPYIVKDIFLVVFAYVISLPLKKSIKI